MKHCVVYTLTDPRDSLVKYVGITTDVKNRFSKHKSDKQSKEGILKKNWVLKLLKLGLQPIIDVIDEGDVDYCQKAETSYIKLYRACGAKLKNQMKTGFLFQHTDETKRKISEARKGKPLTEKQIEAYKTRNCAKFWLGKRHSDEVLKRIGDKLKGRKPYNLGVTKYSQEIIDKLKEDYAKGGISQLGLSKKYNISKSSVDRYLKK